MKKDNSKENIIKLIKEFIVKNNRPPVRSDFGRNGLPIIKTVERNAGSLNSLRKELGFGSDQRTGSDRRIVMKNVETRERKYYPVVDKDLLKYFPEISIHKESSLCDDRRNRSDYKIFASGIHLYVDIFFPIHKASFYGCLNSKIKKYNSLQKLIINKNYQILLVNMNPKVTSKDLKRKNVLPDKFVILDYPEFIHLCEQYRVVL